MQARQHRHTFAREVCVVACGQPESPFLGIPSTVVVSQQAIPTMSRPKLTALQTRALIEEYKISFRGLLSPSQWPRDAPKIFARIRQMRLVEFDTYNQDDTGGGRFSSVDQLKKSAYELVREATTDRKKRLKENPLRLSTEPLVFRRFKEEMKWSGTLLPQTRFFRVLT